MCTKALDNSAVTGTNEFRLGLSEVHQSHIHITCCASGIAHDWQGFLSPNESPDDRYDGEHG